MRQKSILITGASRGIGAACTRHFARKGYAVGLNYFQSKDEAMALTKELQAEGCTVLPLYADVSDAAQVQRMVDTVLDNFCQLDTLLCNAGVCEFGLFTELPDEEFWRIMQVNLGGVYNACRAVIPHFVHHKAGQIVTVSSIWGLVGASYETAYATSKAAIIGLTKSLAKELGPSHIRVNCVAPGVIDTRMSELLDEETREIVRSQTPLGVIGSVEDVAESVWFLASEAGRFYTGQVLSPNGGFTI